MKLNLQKKTLSIIVPCLNEQGDLEKTVNTITSVIEGVQDISDFEILIFDDGSQDQTPAIVDQLARDHKNIRAIHNPQTMALGYSYREGVKIAKMDYVGWLPGKNSVPEETLTRMFNAVGQADVVLVYILSESRGYFRRFISRIFTLLMNILFGMRIKYFNGPCIHRRDLLNRTPMTTNGFAFMAEINIRLIKAGFSFVEVGLHNRDRSQGNSSAFVFRNFLRVLNLIFKLFWEIQVKDRLRPESSYRRRYPVEAKR